MTREEAIEWLKWLKKPHRESWICDAVDIAIEALTAETGGTYQCFHCCTKGVIWDNDFTFEDCGYEGEGLVHFCHCVNCGAEIEYRIPLDDPDEEDDKSIIDPGNDVIET